MPYVSNFKSLICPEEGAEARQAVVALIGRATKSVYVGAYGFTDPLITDALIEAHKRGVVVRCLIDHVQAAGKAAVAELNKMAEAGIPHADLPEGQSCYLVGTSEIGGGIRHYKNCIVDEETVEFGSVNYSETGFMEQDNDCCIIDSASFAKWKLDQFLLGWAYVAKQKYNVTSVEGTTSDCANAPQPN